MDQERRPENLLGVLLDAFHRLVQDEYVRRYMMDGQVFPREWSEARVRESQALLERR